MSFIKKILLELTCTILTMMNIFMTQINKITWVSLNSNLLKLLLLKTRLSRKNGLFHRCHSLTLTFTFCQKNLRPTPIRKQQYLTLLPRLTLSYLAFISLSFTSFVVQANIPHCINLMLNLALIMVICIGTEFLQVLLIYAMITTTKKLKLNFLNRMLKVIIYSKEPAYLL